MFAVNDIQMTHFCHMEETTNYSLIQAQYEVEQQIFVILLQFKLSHLKQMLMNFGKPFCRKQTCLFQIGDQDNTHWYQDSSRPCWEKCYWSFYYLDYDGAKEIQKAEIK